MYKSKLKSVSPRKNRERERRQSPFPDIPISRTLLLEVICEKVGFESVHKFT